jgi:hypothetical protein
MSHDGDEEGRGWGLDGVELEGSFTSFLFSITTGVDCG